MIKQLETIFAGDSSQCKNKIPITERVQPKFFELERENIFREYADQVADGVIERFRTLSGRSTAFTNYSP